MKKYVTFNDNERWVDKINDFDVKDYQSKIINW